MKSLPLTLIAAGALIAGGCASTSHVETPAADSRASVTFVNPEHFTDASDDSFQSDYGRDGNLAELRHHIEKQASAYVPEGGKLEITVTDVDLAGAFEPWRGAHLADVRIMKDIYPPKMVLSYKLLDAKGAVVREATDERLLDLSYLQTITMRRDDPLRYDKSMIDDWFRKEFRGLKST